MRNLHTFKLNSSKLGAPAPRQTAPAEDVEAATATVELPAPAAPAETADTAAPRTARAAAGPKILVALLALDAVATLAGVDATGSIHSHAHLVRLVTILLVSVAATAVLAGTAVAYSARRPRSTATTAAAPPAKRGFSTSKAILVLMLLMGIVAYFGGAGTFAGFTAETSNPNDALAAGTLTLQNQVNSNSACNSQAGASNNNINANCDVALAFGTSTPGQEPGVFVGTATIKLTNTGSLPASKLYLWAPWSNAVYNGATQNGSVGSPITITTLSVYTSSGHGPIGLEGPMAAGDLITITSGTQSQSFCVGTGGAAAGPSTSSIPIAATCTVNSVTYTNALTIPITAGATIQDVSSDTAIGADPPSSQTPNTNCYDTQVTNLTWNPATYDDLCRAALLYVQEISTTAGNNTGSSNYCWFGNGANSANGMCTAPISAVPSAGVPGGGVIAPSTTYTVPALQGNIVSGDKLWFTMGANTVECYAAANYYYGATSIATNSTACVVQSGTNTGFTNAGTTITDKSTLNTIASDYSSSNNSADSIASFDTLRNYGLKKELTAVGLNGNTSATGTDLAASATREFVVGVIIPGSALNQNQLQGLKSTFGLVWHLDQ
jgi:hypothetical protein